MAKRASKRTLKPVAKRPGGGGVPSRYELYRACVQDPSRMVGFVAATHGGEARVLREDFSGPASLSIAWAGLSAAHRAVAVDVDPEPLAFARERLVSVGAELAGRVELVCADVRAAKHRADCVALLNFAVCELHERAALVGYFAHLRACLRPGGVVVLDIYGGENAWTPGRTSTHARLDDGRRVGYTWRQVDADARTGMVRNAIDFRVGAARLEKAFEYYWRLWSIAELRDALIDAGLGAVEVHDRLGVAQRGDGGLVVRAMDRDDRLEGDWVAYVVARREGR